MKIAVYAAIAVGGFLAFSLVSFWLAVRPPRMTVPLRPADFGLGVEEVAIETGDGLRLGAWLILRPGAPAVILLHGYPAEKSDMLPLAATLAPHFTVLLLDLRYFGASEGHATTLGFRERGDLQRAIDTLVARGVDAIGVFGFSLGGAVALLAAAEDPRIRAVAAYAPFADLRQLGQELYAWLGPLRRPFVALMLGWARLVFGHDISRPAPVDAATALAVPVLLIASREDEQIPFTHAERLGRALARNPRAELLTLPHGRHGEIPEDLRRRLLRFFLLYVN